MKAAIREACVSLREGNHGFGAIIVKGSEVITLAHDQDKTNNDPTSHAEMNALRVASLKLKGNLEGCTIISTHEPCPMCASAIVWSGIRKVVYGYSICESFRTGRKRINIPAEEIFSRSGVSIKVIKDIMLNECAVLYNDAVRKNIKMLRDDKIAACAEEITSKRIAWINKNSHLLENTNDGPLNNAYKIFLAKIGITEKEAYVVEQNEKRIVLHSSNFCPTLEACKILHLDTRVVCKKLNEAATEKMLQCVNKNLRFTRNYKKLRPYTDFCEEIIYLDGELQNKQ